MNKKLFDIGYCLISLALLLAFGIVVADAAEAQPHRLSRVFIPGEYSRPKVYTISGRLVSLQHTPIANAIVRTATGQAAFSDHDGYFILEGLPGGDYTLRPFKGNTVFSPISAAVIVPPGINNLNFFGLVTGKNYVNHWIDNAMLNVVDVSLLVMPLNSGKLAQAPR
jgi:hypothetical protein